MHPPALAHRRRMPFARALVLATALLSAAAAPCAELIVATTPSALSLPLDVAQAQNYFEAEGVTVRLLECSSGPRCMELMFSGGAHVVTATELPVMFGSFERSGYAVIGTFATSTTNIKLIARRSAAISGPASLVGKRIGVIVGSSSHYFLDAYLLFHGIDPKQIQLVPLLPESIVAAIERRQVDAFAGYSRHTAPALKVLGADGLTLENPRIYTETYNLVTSRGTLQQREGDVVALLRALARAGRFIAEHPQQAKALMRDRAKLSSAFVDEIFAGFTYRLSLDQSLISTMEGEARWALREGHVAAGQKIPNYLDFIDPGPLRKAAPSTFPN